MKTHGQTAAWRTSTHSVGANNECVEVAPLEGVTGVRDSKGRDRGHIEATPQAWTALLATLRK